MDDLEDIVESLSPVVGAFRKMGIRHYVGGSIASSFHGAARATMDVDLVCELTIDDISEFVQSVGAQFYSNEIAIREAVRRKSCFNLIHLPTSFKVDIFVSRGRPFDLESMDRAELQRLGGSQFVELPIATAEDTIISKLEWFRLSNETSERQWNDVARRLVRRRCEASQSPILPSQILQQCEPLSRPDRMPELLYLIKLIANRRRRNAFTQQHFNKQRVCVLGIHCLGWCIAR